MATSDETRLREYLAREIRDASRELSVTWSTRITASADVRARSAYPGSTLLDHLPTLILEISDYLIEEPADVVRAADTTKSAAARLGDLRFEQHASIQQVLSEFDALADVMAEFVAARLETEQLPATAAGAVRVVARIRTAIRVLQLTTVDRFVARYAALAEARTSQFRDFNLLVSHELRQPLSVLTVTTLMLGERYADPEFLTLQRNVHTLVQVVDKLERLAGAPDAGDGGRPIEPVPVEQVVDDCVAQVQALAAERQVRLEVRRPLPVLTADRARLDLVITNLLNNAIKYADDTKADRWVRVRSADAREGQVAMCIEDNGVGIPDDQLEHVFERFVRASGGADEGGGQAGFGLGLALVRESMLLMGGRVQLASRDGGGLIATLVWPEP